VAQLIEDVFDGMITHAQPGDEVAGAEAAAMRTAAARAEIGGREFQKPDQPPAGRREMFHVEQVVGGRPQTVEILHRRAARRARQRPVVAQHDSIDGWREAMIGQLQHGQFAFAKDGRINGRAISQQVFGESGRVRAAGHHQCLRAQQRFGIFRHDRPLGHTGGDER